MNSKIKLKLEELSDEKYKEFHKKLCNTKYEILGVRLPLLRNIAKELSKGEWREYILNSKNEVYEEIMLQALVIGYAKIEIEEIKKYLEIVLPKIDNWAICDSMCNNLKIAKIEKEEMWQYMMDKLNTNKEYEIRFSYVMMLNYYIELKYLNKIFEGIENNKLDKYYIKMAISWLISCIYIKYPKETITFLNNCNLDRFTYNKSLQKIIESYRVTNEEKEVIRKMKKR